MKNTDHDSTPKTRDVIRLTSGSPQAPYETGPAKQRTMPRQLDREKWHKPLISIIITHHNYSNHIEDALLSILDQTHENWECIIVDDRSIGYHRQALHNIVNAINDARIKTVELNENIGQIRAFFEGLDHSKGRFVCPLDPDDRYTRTFLQESLAAHHDETVFCSIVCSDQYMLDEGEVITAVVTHNNSKWCCQPEDRPERKFIPASNKGWHWSSTSSLMLRRAALYYMRPFGPVIIPQGTEMRGLDGYLAPAAHQMGGSIFICKPLVYRGAHDNNSWLRRERVSLSHRSGRDEALSRGTDIRKVADEVLKARDAPIAWKKQGSKTLNKWKRSINKRLQFLLGYWSL